MTAACQAVAVKRLVDKIARHYDQIERLELDGVEDADCVVIAYGITARVARMAVELARAEGLKVGMLRLITVWPFPEARIRALAGRVKSLVVPEINLGQVVLEVERCAAGQARTVCVPHPGGAVHDPEVILAAIRESLR
jgi:2-oxoglutarate ferredoxin oxidoreductase subunit alpha